MSKIALSDWNSLLAEAGSDLPKELLDAVTTGENPSARRTGSVETDLTSPKGARGVGQIMPSTQASLEKLGLVPTGLNPANPRDNALLTAATLRESLGRTGNVRATLAEYNGGSAARSAVERGEQPPAAETRRYLEMNGMSDGLQAAPGQQVFGSRKEGTSEKVRDPIYVDAMLSTLAQHTKTNAALLDSLATNTQGAVEQLSNLADEQAKIGSAEADSIRAQAEIDTANQQQSQNIRQAMGATILDPNSRIAQANRNIAAAQVAQDQLRPEIEAKAQVGFLDNPLEYVINQFQLPQMKRQYNAMRDVEILNTQRVQQIQQSTSNQIVYDVPNVINAVNAKSTAMAAAKQAEGLAKAAQTRTQVFQMQAALVTQQLANSNADANMHEMVYSKLVDLGTMNEQLGERTAAEKQLAADVNPFNMKMAAIGAQPYSVAAWKDQPPQQRQAARTLGNGVGYGGNMGEVLENLERFNITPAFASAGITSQAWTQIQTSASPTNPDYQRALKEISTPGQPGYDSKFQAMPPEMQRATVLSRMHAKYVSEAQRKTDGTYGAGAHNLLSEQSPYRLDSRYAVSDPALNGNLVADWTKAQIAANTLRPPTDTQIAGQALNLAMADPANVRKYAEQMSQFFRSAVNKQYESKQLAMLGFPRIEDYALSGLDNSSKNPRKVQALNPADVENWMMRQITSMQARKSAQSFDLLNFNSDAALSQGFQ